MPYYNRKPTRIPDFDYSQGFYYFVTICTYEKKYLFGMGQKLTELGKIAWTDLLQVPEYYDGVQLDHFVVMPNHIHAILVLDENRQKTTDLSQIIGAYKAGVSRKARKLYPEITLWQRSYHDHVIRNRLDYENIWKYIDENPLKWEEDCFYQK